MPSAPTPLRLTFDSAVRLGTEGRLTAHRADGVAVDTVDLADPATYQRLIADARSDYGQPHRWNYEPVVVTGRTATVLLHRTRKPGQRYHVTVDPGFFLGHRGITSPNEWRFRTADAPRSGIRHLRVDARGCGDFCTVQGAVDSVPEGNRGEVRIDVAPGTYRELVHVGPSRPHLPVRGAGAGRTVIGHPNNNCSTATPPWPTCRPSRGTARAGCCRSPTGSTAGAPPPRTELFHAARELDATDIRTVDAGPEAR
ncbi:pectinesterase family protein [Streptomyces sp. NPDC001599]|uniref:pectinesterase family protein n=1 Tax=Streptomyces sp. NPDC001599 TaxID=3364591 RepID=UPI0036880B18